MMLVSSTTFEGFPFTISLSPSDIIGNGSTAKIFKGTIVDNQPLVVAVKLFGQMLNPLEEEVRPRAARYTAHPEVMLV
ncbi:hypothetical protein AURDEDRAFT_116943 [Auricularia subglabra TFB-10046 SS5]|nr:hypothetical protein AURDEDRAFT_116943 [Auricularia subglabra TFB-10046 SS5]